MPLKLLLLPVLHPKDADRAVLVVTLELLGRLLPLNLCILFFLRYNMNIETKIYIYLIMNICVPFKNISNDISIKILYIIIELNSITLSGTRHSRFIPVSLYVRM